MHHQKDISTISPANTPIAGLMSARPDLALIAALIPPKVRLLDVGCGDGALLALLVAQKGVEGRGLELDSQAVTKALAAGLLVVQGDADEDLAHYPDNAFDYVVMSQTLQATRQPHKVLAQLLRLGRRVIVAIPNFGYWRVRAALMFGGRMPVTRQLGYQWYETPNIHFCTLEDFERLVRAQQARCLERLYLGPQGRPLQGAQHWGANWRAERGVYLLSKSAEGA
jgi:methionine biosynthesis protein MetW